MLEIELNRRNIPFVKFGGLKFVEAAHVKDLLAVLRWAENPSDRVTGFRVLQLLDGIGPSTAGKGARPHGRTNAARRPPHHPSARQGRRGLARAARADAAIARQGLRMARRNRGGAALVPAPSRSALRGCRRPGRRPRSAPADRGGVSLACQVPHRPHPRSAERHQRRGGTAPCATRITSFSRPSTRPRARSGGRCSCSMSSMAASRPI